MRNSARYGMGYMEAGDGINIETINTALQLLEDALPIPVLKQTNAGTTAYQAEARFAGLTGGMSVLLVPVASNTGAVTLELRRSGATLGGVKKVFSAAGVQVQTAGDIKAYVPAYCIYSAALDSGAGGWTYYPLSAVVKTGDIQDSAVTDAKIGERAVVDTTAPTDDLLMLGEALNSVAYMLKAITGKANWRTLPDYNLATLKTYIDTKSPTIEGGASTIVTANLTAQRALMSDASGKVAVSAVTATELGRLSGIASSVQGQLDALVLGTQRAGEATNALNLGGVAAAYYNVYKGYTSNPVDFNTLVDMGTYTVPTSSTHTNAPFVGAGGTLRVLNRLNTGAAHVIQEFYAGDSATCWYRQKTAAGVWSAWVTKWKALAASVVLATDASGGLDDTGVSLTELTKMQGIANGTVKITAVYG